MTSTLRLCGYVLFFYRYVTIAVVERSEMDAVKYTRVSPSISSDTADCYGDNALPSGPAQPYKQLDPTVFETNMDALCDSLNTADFSMTTKLTDLDSLCDMFEKLHLV